MHFSSQRVGALWLFLQLRSLVLLDGYLLPGVFLRRPLHGAEGALTYHAYDVVVLDGGPIEAVEVHAVLPRPALGRPLVLGMQVVAMVALVDQWTLSRLSPAFPFLALIIDLGRTVLLLLFVDHDEHLRLAFLDRPRW